MAAWMSPFAHKGGAGRLCCSRLLCQSVWIYPSIMPIPWTELWFKIDRIIIGALVLCAFSRLRRIFSAIIVSVIICIGKATAALTWNGRGGGCDCEGYPIVVNQFIPCVLLYPSDDSRFAATGHRLFIHKVNFSFIVYSLPLSLDTNF